MDGTGIRPVDYQDTDHYQVTKQFLDSPERFLKHLFADVPDADSHASGDEAVDESLVPEIERRVDEVRGETAEPIPADVLLAELKAKPSAVDDSAVDFTAVAQSPGTGIPNSSVTGKARCPLMPAEGRGPGLRPRRQRR